MAERPGELEEKISSNIDENNDVAITTETSDNTYLNNRSDDNYSGDENTDINDASEDTEQIRANIEETRSQMGETIDAIQEKLSFSNISEQVKEEVSGYVNETIQTAKDTVYDATIRKVGNVMNYVNEMADTKIVRTARQNPLAIGLIGLGLGILFFGGSRKKKSKYRYNNDYDYDRDNQNYGRRFSSKDNQSTLATAQNKVSDAASAVSDKVSSAAGAVSDTVSGAAGAVSNTVGNVASKAYKQVGNLGSQAQDLAGTAQDQYEYYIEENPLAVGAVVMALGAAVGLAIPSTRVENRWMGETRENLIQKAEETARDAIGKVQQVAGQVTETVKEEAKNQGLT